MAAGGVDESKQHYGAGSFANLLHDVRFGLRMLGKSRSTTAILLVTLALGIGANTATFTLINGLMLRSLPVDHPEQLYLFGNDQWYGSHSGTFPTGTVDLYSYQFFQQFREQNHSLFDGVTATASPQPHIHVTIPKSGELPRRFVAGLVDGDFFHILGVNAIRGRVQ